MKSSTEQGWVITCAGCGYQTDPDERRLGQILKELSDSGWHFNLRDLCKKCVNGGKPSERFRV